MTDATVDPKDQQTTTLHLAVQTNDMEVVKLIGDQYKLKIPQPQLKELVFKQKDNLTGMSPAKYASKSKALAKDSEKYFKQLCKK